MSDIDKDVVRYVATDLDPIMVPDPIGAWVRFEDYLAKSDRIEELEAKLAKAVDAIDGLLAVLPDDEGPEIDYARTTIAEMKGEK